MDPNHLEQVLKAPPSWAMNLGLAGKALVFGALALFLLASVLYGTGRVKPGRLAFGLGSGFLLGVMVILGVLLQTHQYQFKYIYSHSDNNVTPYYNLAAIWSGQEGSFLLWAMCSAAFGVFALRKSGLFERWMGVPYGLFLAALAAILAYESPFAIQLIEGKLLMPPDGGGLEPTLMNYWFLIHPPVMFLGFGSLTLLYCWAMSALISREVDGWIKPARPWMILSATLLGTGLAMGGFWAYETLGWGGFWAWDPVENVSFVSWVWVITLIHGAFIQLAQNKFRSGNLWLAGTSLVSFCYGTFLTRSGLMGDTSVHSFAEMDRSALWILVGLMSASLIAFGVVFARFKPGAAEARVKQPQSIFNLGTLYPLGMTILMILGAAATVGMSTPVLTKLRGAQSTVATETYHQITVWFFVPLAIAMAIAPFTNWRGLAAKALWKRLEIALGLSLLFTGVLLLWYKFMVPAALHLPKDEVLNTIFTVKVPTVGTIMTLAWVCLFGIMANGVRIVETWRNARQGVGSYVSHVGVLVALLGLIVSRGLERHEFAPMRNGEPASMLGYTVKFEQEFTKNLDRENRVPLSFTSPTGGFEAKPVHYFKDPNAAELRSVFRPDILRHPLYDLYVAVTSVQVQVGPAQKLKQGTTLVIDEGEQLTYQGLRRDGQAGQAGTTFFADMIYRDSSGESKVSPGLKLGGGGRPEQVLTTAGPYIFSLQSMDAADKSVMLEVYYKSPLFPVQLFFKPLTILVWLGIGIMTLGGFWAAYYRRKAHPPRGLETADEEIASGMTDKERDATVAIP